MGNWRPDEAYHGILDAAIDLFHARGCASVSLREIAAAAKVPTGTLSTHFPTRRALVRAVARRMREARRACLGRLRLSRTEPYERLLVLVERLDAESRRSSLIAAL